jgi:hypothetical protein
VGGAVRGGPVGWQQGIELIRASHGHALDDILKVGLRIDAMIAGAAEQGGHDRRAFSGFGGEDDVEQRRRRAFAKGAVGGTTEEVNKGGISFDSGAANGAKYTIRSNMGNKPVNYVSWYDAARFTNWLHNGQGSGSTETGAYTLSGNTGIITKNVSATVWLPSEDEWYKAAYYDPSKGGTGGYWLHATQSDTAPTVGSANLTGDISNPGANVANYNCWAGWACWLSCAAAGDPKSGRRVIRLTPPPAHERPHRHPWSRHHRDETVLWRGHGNRVLLRQANLRGVQPEGG